MEKKESEIAREIKAIAGFDTENIIKAGLITPKQAVKWIVKQKYYQMAKESNRTYTDIKLELSVKYDVSVSSIEKMVYRDR
ncbi:MAG: hypothetical protein IH595_11700 [Bacteroidales bacterium]|nr:hypothetical protein [Bacteroidales bacterium]